MPTDCKVIFIDYGNESISNDLRELPEDIVGIEELAVHCALKEPLQSKQREQLSFIHGDDIFQMHFHDFQSDPKLVSLYLNEKNVIDVLEMHSNAQIIAEEVERGVINDIVENGSENAEISTEGYISNGTLRKDDTTRISKSIENISKEAPVNVPH